MVSMLPVHAPYQKLLALAVASSVSACGSPQTEPRPAPKPSATVVAPPRLVVLLVLDQWPEWAFDIKRDHLHAGGFDRLLSEGAWHVGRHPSATTLTAPGHALLG